jgi:hypothetical protein
MLDDYSLRLLAEMGVDVYLPRDAAAVVSAVVHAVGPSVGSVAGHAHADGEFPPSTKPVGKSIDLLILCREGDHKRLLADLLRGVRMAGLDASIAEPGQSASIALARGLLVLGESLARSLGAEMPAQRQNEMAWIVTHEPIALAQSAEAKRALWGEIKRLSRARPARALSD